MSEPQVRIERETPADAPEDVEMGGDGDVETTEVLEVEAPTGEAQNEADEAVDEAAQADLNKTFVECVYWQCEAQFRAYL